MDEQLKNIQSKQNSKLKNGKCKLMLRYKRIIRIN